MLFRKLASLLLYSYNPIDRDYSGALNFLNSNLRLLNKNKTDDVLRNFDISDVHKKEFGKDIKEVLSTIFITGFDLNQKETVYVNNHLFKGNFRKDDTINDPKVMLAIKKGLDFMRKCRDPAHDVTHIIRCIRFARYLYDKEYNDLDWGTVATAVVWHDISRTKDLGIFHRESLEALRHLPVFVDIDIIENNINDADKSKYMIEQNFRRFGLDDEFIKKVGNAISGSDNTEILKNIFGNKIKSRYKQIMYDVDTIDIFTLGRWESSNRNVIHKNIGDGHILNRRFLLCFIFAIPNAYFKTYSSTTKKICKLSIAVNLSHAKKFYPTDYLYVLDTARRTGLIKN